MAEVRTRDEAIASVAHALQTWSSSVAGILTQAQHAAQAARSETEAAARKYADEVAALESLLATADDERRRELQVTILRAREFLERTRRAHARIAQVETRTTQLNRAHITAARSQISSAYARLSAMSRALDGYRSGGAGLGGGGSVGGTASHAGGGAVAGVGLANLDVRAADLDDNPVLDDNCVRGTFGKGGLSRADYRWMVQTWNDTVGPGVAAGKTRDDFVERDIRSDAPPLRRTADVYDIFLGSERIRADRRSDGSLDIINGRHRLLIARELGIKSLPGQVSE